MLTIGVYGFTAEAFEQAVISAKPDVFVDVRRRRGVRGHQYAFANSGHLQDMLQNNHIPYVHHLELAPDDAIVKHEGEVDHKHHIARHQRDQLSPEFVAAYRKQVLDHFEAKTFIASLGENIHSVLLMCVESTPEACHRGMLAEAIHQQLGWEREDLLP